MLATGAPLTWRGHIRVIQNKRAQRERRGWEGVRMGEEGGGRRVARRRRAALRSPIWCNTCRDTHKALASELELTPISNDFSTFYQIIPIISNSLICGLCSTNVRGVMILSTFVEARHWRGGLIVECGPQMSSHHIDFTGAHGKNDTTLQWFWAISPNQHLEQDNCGVWSTPEKQCKKVTLYNLYATTPKIGDNRKSGIISHRKKNTLRSFP